MGYVLVVITFAALLKEAARLYAELKRSAAIDKAEKERWLRWHWQPTAEEAAKLAADVAESKRLIAAYNEKQRQKQLAALLAAAAK